MNNLQPAYSRDGKRKSFVFQTAPSGEVVKLKIHQRDGGMNYFSGRTELRGIEMTIGMVEVSETNGVRFERSAPMNDNNARVLILETARYSEKKLDAVAAALDAQIPDLAQLWQTDLPAAKERLLEIARQAGERLAA